MNEPIFHPATTEQLMRLVSAPPHAVLLVAPSGSGKQVTGLYLAAKVLQQPVERLALQPYFLQVQPAESGSLTIDTVRSLQADLKLKTIGKDKIRRIVLLEQAESLTTEAQNALLKLLEEPPIDTMFILTTADATRLLPTVLSRLQKLTIGNIAEIELVEYFQKQGFDEAAVKQAYALSEGRIGLLASLLAVEPANSIHEHIDTIKRLLAGDSFERLLFTEQVSKDKTQLAVFLDALLLIARASLFRSVSNGSSPSQKRWLNLYKKALLSKQRLNQNAQPKLLLDDLLLTM